MSPYRQPIAPEEEAAAADERERCPDADLVPIFALFWIASVARVVLGLRERGGFGAESVLAAMAVVLVPFVLRYAILWCLRRAAQGVRQETRDLLPERDGPRLASRTVMRTRRWRGLAVALLALAGFVAFVWVATSSRRAERDAVLNMPATERAKLYLDTKRSAEAICAQAAKDDALSERCIDGAQFLLAFPECDAECRAFAERHRPSATR